MDFVNWDIETYNSKYDNKFHQRKLLRNIDIFSLQKFFMTGLEYLTLFS